MQVGRKTSLETRGNVAYFGTFGYELDLSELSKEEKETIQEQVKFHKEHRELIQNGLFYRISSPFDQNIASWIVVSENREEALAAYYQVLNSTNEGWKRFRLTGLDNNKRYMINGNEQRLYYGDELMQVGLVIDDDQFEWDFESMLFYIKECK
jgi:Alpha-galactosidase